MIKQDNRPIKSNQLKKNNTKSNPKNHSTQKSNRRRNKSKSNKVSSIISKLPIPKLYEVSDDIDEELLLQNGFKKHLDYYSYSKVIQKFFQIKLNIYINEEDRYLIPIVLDNNGTYAPFYNPEFRYNNKVCNDVIIEYNKFMDSLVKKKILIHKPKENKVMDKTIKIKYFTDKIDKLKYIDGKSDWIDLRAAETVELKKGEFKLIPLGIAMELPEGYEAHVVPRSSAYKQFGIIETNSMGIIDESYCGDNDQWFFPAYALRDTVIHINERICQFRIVKHQPKIEFDEVTVLDNPDRKGHGSTGKI